MSRLDLEETPERRAGSDPDSTDDGEGTLRFRLALATLGLDERAARGHASLAERLSSRRPRTAPSVPPPPSTLPLITVGSSASDAELTLKAEIGDGGMGVVFAASQRSLGREVAVKRLVPEAQGDEARDALVQEARVTGSLEHPNVVPVHALGSDAQGRPLMVMRRVHGTPWGTLLRERRGPEWAHEGDMLAAHLEILLQVCNVVRFAHSRGVIHGDLKPDNVMLGAYGEIYVLDWGAAMSTRPGDPRGLPFAGDVRTVNGTPAYMAPEMVGAGMAISERTDVYLLGAVLHEILVGAPPHGGSSIYATMKSAFKSRPFPYARDVPRELAAVCHRAMAADPARRYPDVEALRHAVAEHLEHRVSIALAAESEERLPRLLAAIAEPGSTQRGGRVVYPLYAECRFGFQQALRIWPGNEEAQAGLERAVSAMVSFTIDAGDAQAAALLLTQLKQPHHELKARLAELSQRVRAEGAELSRLRDLERDLDVDSAARPRRLFIAALAALGVVLVPLQLWLDPPPAGAQGVRRLVAVLLLPAAFMIIMAAGAWIGRRRVFTTRTNRAIVGGAFVAGGASFANRALTQLVRGAPLAEAVANDLFILAVVAAMIAVSSDRRFAVAAAWFVAVGAAAEVFPAHAVPLFALALLGFGVGKALSGGGSSGGVVEPAGRQSRSA
jgi:serine/threonine protein kinase